MNCYFNLVSINNSQSDENTFFSTFSNSFYISFLKKKYNYFQNGCRVQLSLIALVDYLFLSGRGVVLGQILVEHLKRCFVALKKLSCLGDMN